jgi:actin-related protein 2
MLHVNMLNHICVWVCVCVCVCTRVCVFAGMADLVVEVVNAADMDTRLELYKHVVLSGGSTMYRGLPSRLEADIRARYLRETLKGDKTRIGVRTHVHTLYHACTRYEAHTLYHKCTCYKAHTRIMEYCVQKFKLHIEDPPRRKHMVFLGGSVLGDIMSTHDDFWMWKKDYEEHGALRLMEKFSGGGTTKK